MNVTVKYNQQDIIKNLNRKIKAFGKAKIGSMQRLARLTLLEAKKRAARDSGETMRGITISKTPKGHRCTSVVSGTFKQNLFQNQTSPYGRLNFGPRGGAGNGIGYYGPNQSVRYGGSATSFSGNQISWTGEPRFFDTAVAIARKRAKKLTVRATSSALKLGVATWSTK